MFRTLVPLVTLVGLLTVMAPLGAQQADGSRPAAKAHAAAIVNINTAPASEFETLPGIGAKTAARIVEYRQKNGPFKKIEELMNVRGIGEKNFLKLKGQLSVATAKTEHDGHPEH